MYTLPAALTSPPVIETLRVCEAMPGVEMVNEYDPPGRYRPYCPSDV
jgi:hypothetical protein